MWSPHSHCHGNCHNFQSHQFSIVSWKHGLRRPEVRSFARLTDLSAMNKERECAIFSDSVQVVVNNKPGCFYLDHRTISLPLYTQQSPPMCMCNICLQILYKSVPLLRSVPVIFHLNWLFEKSLQRAVSHDLRQSFAVISHDETVSNGPM